MSTVLYRRLGEQFLDANGVPLAGYLIYYYQSGTTNLQNTYSEQTGATPNSNPIILDSSGRLTTPVFLGSTYDYKETLTNASSITVSPWPFDGIPKATTVAAAQTGYERLYQPWTSISLSPHAPGLAAAGNAYEYDCTGGNITVTLPSAATSGITGLGFTFKKIDSTANQIVVTPDGSDTIDGANLPLYIGVKNMVVGLTSDGAKWLATLFSSIPFMLAAQKQAVTASSSTLNIDMSKGWNVVLTLSATVTTFTTSNWPASGTLGKLQIEIISTGAYNITDWPGAAIWYNGTAPTITSGNGKKDTIVLTCNDGGDNTTGVFRGYVAAVNMS